MNAYVPFVTYDGVVVVVVVVVVVFVVVVVVVFTFNLSFYSTTLNICSTPSVLPDSSSSRDTISREIRMIQRKTKVAKKSMIKMECWRK